MLVEFLSEGFESRFVLLSKLFRTFWKLFDDPVCKHLHLSLYIFPDVCSPRYRAAWKESKLFDMEECVDVLSELCVDAH